MGSKTMIRNATNGDVVAIAEIYNWYVTYGTETFETETVAVEEMRGRMTATINAYPFIVYDDGGRVLGYAYAHQWKARAAYQLTWETSVYVATDQRHKGIGRALMERLIDACRRAGCRVLIACITQGNVASEALHRQLGFKQVSAFEQVGVKFGKTLGVTDWELML